MITLGAGGWWIGGSWWRIPASANRFWLVEEAG